MCLGVPGKVLAVDGKTALVDFWGLRKDVKLDILEEPVAPGDYILNHVGYAIRRITDADVAETLALYEVLLSEAGEDPLATDIVDELERSEEIDEPVGVP
ncbi:MAG TPA: HypC/HybG/HupF family hydrogenase formation chaperone [Thermoanaerobaculia bacterium]|nr:HypC/HybG/HupF family hydrogenase formation chaperone [Thermoanaerobaculia bacterium]